MCINVFQAVAGNRQGAVPHVGLGEGVKAPHLKETDY